ncbi:unnamed protein product, partial [Mesorhabditis spiculigera]
MNALFEDAQFFGASLCITIIINLSVSIFCGFLYRALVLAQDPWILSSDKTLFRFMAAMHLQGLPGSVLFYLAKPPKPLLNEYFCFHVKNGQEILDTGYAVLVMSPELNSFIVPTVISWGCCRDKVVNR